MQVQLFRFCGKDPIEFWEYTPAETELMVQTASEKYSQEYEFNSAVQARLCAIVLNANGVTKKGKKPFEVNDFMPAKKSKPKTPEQLEHMAKTAAMRLGGSVTQKV